MKAAASFETKLPSSSTNDLSRLEREHRVAASLRETLAVLNSNRCLDDILQFIVHQARSILTAQAAAIYCPTGQKGLLQIQAQEGLSEAYAREARISLGALATGQATLTRKPTAIYDIAAALSGNDPEMSAEDAAILSKLAQSYQALLSVPLVFPKGEVYGTLNLYYACPRSFTNEEVSLAKAYSDQAILAIENARLRTRVEQVAILSERDRLARDLHDTVTQTLFSASLIADVLPGLWDQDPQNGRVALNELSQLSRGALAEMRTLLFELRPAALLAADIHTLMQQLVHAFSSRTRIPVVYETNRFECPLPPDAKIALYRITQELLTNIEKHAHASQVNVSFGLQKARRSEKVSAMHCRKCRSQVRIVVADNGRGFDTGSITSDHMGLRIIRERAEGIHAALVIDSTPGHGTRVEVVW